MKKRLIALIVVVVMVLGISGSTQAYKFAEDWTWKDTAYQSVFLALTVADWSQTRWMARQNWQWDGKSYRETNPFLGDFPTTGKVDTLIPLGMLAHTVIAMAIPPRSCTEEQEKNGRININFRRIWQMLFIGLEVGAVWNNFNIGAKFEF